MNLPNKLTILRIIMSFVFMFFIFSEGLFAKSMALVFFTIASITDFFDGYIARKYNLITDLGKLLDPIADKILVLTAFLAFVEMKIVAAWMVALIILRELLITGTRIFLAKKGKVIAASHWGKHKTVSQMVSIFVILGVIVLKEAGMGYYSFWTPDWEFSCFFIINFLMYITIILTVVSGINFFVKNSDVFKNQ